MNKHSATGNDEAGRATLLAVDRAAGELRRGQPVLITGPGEAVIALAAETCGEAAMRRLAGWGAAALRLALTAHRARALNIRPSGHDPVLVELHSWLDAPAVRGIADATTDLSAPLRGPFERELRAPTESEKAAILLAKQARLLPAMLLLPVSPAEGARIAKAHDLLRVDDGAIGGYERAAALRMERVAAAKVPLAEARDSQLIAFRPSDGGLEHLAILVGTPHRDEPVLVRLHSECFTGDLMGSLKCDCGEQLRGALKLIAETGSGVLLYLAQEGRGIGLMNKLRAYRLQEDGFDTVDANLRLGFEADERVFLPAAEMLRQLGYRRIRLLTNNPEKVEGLRALGIDVVERVPHSFPSNTHNEFYLATKRDRSGHLL